MQEFIRGGNIVENTFFALLPNDILRHTSYIINFQDIFNFVYQENVIYDKESIFSTGNTLLPSSISILTNLTNLDCSFSSMTFLPSSTSCLVNLQTLSIEDNLLTSLPDGISKLTKLCVLRMYSNCITCIPPGIGDCISLKKILCYRNQLSSLPSSMSKLTNLEILHCFGNNIVSTPEINGCIVDNHPYVENNHPIQ